MNSTARKIFLSVGALLLFAAGAIGLVQEQNKSGELIKLETDLVLLEADVLSKKTGQAIGGLTKEDFTLYEDGVKQPITHFSQDKLPLSVLILLDVSGSIWPRMKKLREGALEALENLKPEDEVAVMVFAARPTLILHFTKNKLSAAAAIKMVSSQEIGGETNPNEAVFQAAAYIRNATNPDNRRVIIAVSDDVSTHKVPPHRKSKTIHELLESGGVVCGLFFDSTYKTRPEPKADLYSTGVKQVLISGEVEVVNSYVERTGGVAIEADQQNVKEGFIHLIERLRTRYSFGYVSSNEKRDGGFRKIKLKISPDVDKREKGAAIVTKRGYYARQARGPAASPK
jgi:VWFA-related protein